MNAPIETAKRDAIEPLADRRDALGRTADPPINHIDGSPPGEWAGPRAVPKVVG